MLEQVLQSLNNYFEYECLYGTFTVKGGQINLPDGSVLDGQYFRICGSVFNDGVHEWNNSVLRDETFDGEVYPMAIPQSVFELVNDIEEWCEKNENQALSPFSSESIPNYSYTKSASDIAENGWQSAFRKRLNRYRRL